MTSWLEEEPLFASNNKSPVELVAFSPDGRTLAIGVQYESLKLLDARTYEPQQNLNGECKSAKSVAFTPDGSTLVTACNEGLKLWDMRTRNQLPTRKVSFHTSALALAPDGRALAIADGDDIKLSDLRTPEDFVVLKGHSKSVSCLAFSPDGKMLASGAGDDGIRLWDTRTGQALAAFRKTGPAICPSSRPSRFRPTVRCWPSAAWTAMCDFGTRRQIVR